MARSTLVERLLERRVYREGSVRLLLLRVLVARCEGSTSGSRMPLRLASASTRARSSRCAFSSAMKRLMRAALPAVAERLRLNCEIDRAGDRMLRKRKANPVSWSALRVPRAVMMTKATICTATIMEII